VVVWRGNYLRHNDLPFKDHHWRLPNADLRQEVSDQHNSDGDHRLQPLHDILPLSNDLPMSPYILLLDTVSYLRSTRRWRVMYLKRYHCKLDLRTWGPECSCRLDTGHPTNFHRMEFKHESPNQDLSSSHSSPWSCVRILLFSHVCSDY
jgi:hypothetical protein